MQLGSASIGTQRMGCFLREVGMSMRDAAIWLGTQAHSAPAPRIPRIDDVPRTFVPRRTFATCIAQIPGHKGPTSTAYYVDTCRRHAHAHTTGK